MIEFTQRQVHSLTQSLAKPPLPINPEAQEFVGDGPWTDEERNLLRQQSYDFLDIFGQDCQISSATPSH